MRKLLILAGIASILTLPVAAVAKDHDRGGYGHASGKYATHKGGSVRYDRKHRLVRSHGHRRNCPPGLAMKNNGCLPPGQAWRVGQRSPWNADRYVGYSSLPSYYRDRYPDTSGQQYYYSGNRVYVVDPTTNLIRSIVNILR